MYTIFLVAGAQGVLLSLALFTKNKNRFRANPFLGLVVFISSLELIIQWTIEKNYFNTNGVIPFWLLQSYLVIPPSIWAFNKSNRNEKISSKTLLLIYTPALIEVMCESAFYILYLFSGVVLNLIDFQPWFLFTEVLPILGTIGVLLIEGRRWFLLRKNWLSTNKPTLSQQSIRHGGLFIILALVALLWALGEFVSPELYLYLNFTLTVFLFGLGYIAYFDLSFFLAHIAKENFSNYNDHVQSENLIKVIKENFLYKKPRLSLKELALEVDLPTRYVSYLINEYHSSNFQSFINTFRVNEVITEIQNPKNSNKTFLALAYESGFNSKSSFNKVFKEHTGSTPSEYLRIPKI